MMPVVLRKPHWCPPWGRFRGVTIYPVIMLVRGWRAEELRHELIHCWQVRKVGWLRFYGGYLLDWIRGTAYVDLPAEVEAYAMQGDPTYLPADLEALVGADA